MSDAEFETLAAEAERGYDMRPLVFASEEDLDIELMKALRDSKLAEARLERLVKLRVGPIVLVDAIFIQGHEACALIFDSVEEAQSAMLSQSQVDALLPVATHRGGILMPALPGDGDPEKAYRSHWLHGLVSAALGGG